MPGWDGTGPLGRGPLTGRGFGPCGRGYAGFGGGGRGRWCGYSRGFRAEPAYLPAGKDFLLEVKEILERRLNFIKDKLADLEEEDE